MNELTASFPICDLHCDTALLWPAGRTLEDTSLHVSLPALRQGNVGLQVFAVYVPATVPQSRRFSFAASAIDHFKEKIERHGGDIVLCRSSGEVESVRKQEKIAALLAVENGDAIENDLKNIEALAGMGVRLMTLIHTRSNDWVISSADKQPAFAGLSEFGAEVVQTMNQLGMIIDVSHAHDRAVERVLELSGKPVVASHSGAYSLCPHSRNLKDVHIRGIAASGGVVGVIFQPPFLDCGYRDLVEQKAKKVIAELDRSTEQAGDDVIKLAEAWLKFSGGYKRAMVSDRIPLETFFQHVDHIVDVAGEDSVAFGSDFDGIPDTPQGITDAGSFVAVREGLVQRGYSHQRLRKICWSNFLRVLESVLFP